MNDILPSRPQRQEPVVPPDTSDTPATPAGVRLRQVTRLQQGQIIQRQDHLADEVPIALVFNGISHAVMMATPTDLEDFALGFALSEGLLQHSHELYSLDIVPIAWDHDTSQNPNRLPASEPAQSTVDSPHLLRGIELQLNIASEREWQLKARRRSLEGRTGCGLCGIESLNQIPNNMSAVPSVHISASAISHAHRALQAGQRIQQYTGATHAAAWCSESGQVLLLREDVGRHNALDKLIGALVKAKLNPAQGFIAITSRASFEMVQKTITAGVGMLAAVSAPTALAIETAERHNLVLVGFVRGNDLVAYTYANRLGLI